EWSYRSFIEGGSQAAAIWTFDGITPDVLRTDVDADGTKHQFLPIEIIVRVFRTYKGNIEQGILGSFRLINPETKLESNEETFTAKDDSVNTFDIPTKLYANGKEVDLFNDLVTKDGQLEVQVQCLDSAQYYGFAQPDCYIRLQDASPLL